MNVKTDPSILIYSLSRLVRQKDGYVGVNPNTGDRHQSGKERVHDQVMFIAGTIWSMQRDWHGTVETTPTNETCVLGMLK